MTIKALLPSPRYTCHDATLRHLTLPKQTKLPILGAYKSTPTPRAAIHSPQVVVWCAISAQGTIGPYFFEGDDGVSVTLNAKRYNHMLETFFLLELRRCNWNMARAWFQQDGATAHTARLSMNTLRAAFPGRLLSRFGDIQWPSNSPDLTAVNFLMGVFESSSFYSHPP